MSRSTSVLAGFLLTGLVLSVGSLETAAGKLKGYMFGDYYYGRADRQRKRTDFGFEGFI